MQVESTCPRCYGTNVRTSRFRLSYLFYVLLGKYPVRCRVCHHGFFASLLRVVGLRRAPRKKKPSFHVSA
jgi:predicted Zn-ribbon and HTH transcriptional regulator